VYAAKHAIKRYVSTQASSGGNGSSRGITKDSGGVRGPYTVERPETKRKEKYGTCKYMSSSSRNAALQLLEPPPGPASSGMSRRQYSHRAPAQDLKLEGWMSFELPTSTCTLVSEMNHYAWQVGIQRRILRCFPSAYGCIGTTG
jgi:hypothetical protein